MTTLTASAHRDVSGEPRLQVAASEISSGNNVASLRGVIVDQRALAVRPSAVSLRQAKVANKADKITPINGPRIVVKLPAAAACATASAGPAVNAGAAVARVQAFAAALLKAEVKDVELGCQLLILPDGADGTPIWWPGLESDTLFVRPEFKRMFEDKETLGAFCKSAVPADRRHKLLRGVPGIGTSSFGLYALWRLVTAGRSVLYQYPKGLPFGAAIAFGCQASEPDVNIADGCEPSYSVSDGPARLVISSPWGDGAPYGPYAPPFYHSFSKDAMSLYLREPTEGEVMAMGKHCFGLRDDDAAGHAAARERMSRNGPNPRHVWGRTADEAAALEGAIEGQDSAVLRQFARTESEVLVANEISFRVVHYDVSANCRSVGYKWASPYVGRRVAEVLRESDAPSRGSLSLSLLSELLRKKALRSMGSHLFEDWCSTKMREGGTFRIRRLGVGSATTGAATGVPAALAAKPLPGDSKALAADLDVNLPFKQADAVLGVASIDDDGNGTIAIPKAVRTVQLVKASKLPAASLFAGKRFDLRATATGRECFAAAADFIEANGVCSKAVVDSESAQGLSILGTDNITGLLPIIQQLHPDVTWTEGKGVAVPFVWLVPQQTFAECRAATMQITIVPDPTPATGSGASGSSDEVAAYKLRAALEQSARRLAPWVVQYAVEMPNAAPASRLK